MFQLWLTYRFLTRGRMFNITSVLALLGLMIGVSTLVLTMSVISGVETLLKGSVIDVTGHVMLMKPGGISDPINTVIPQLKKEVPSLRAATPFVHIEAVLARKGKINGVVIQGLDTSTVDDVLNLRSHVVQGQYNLNEINGVDAAIIGKEIAKKFELTVGDQFQVVMPRPSKTDSTSFAPIVAKFIVSGVMDLGKYEFNERFVVTSDLAAQNLAGVGNVYSGLRMRLSDADLSKEAGSQMLSTLGHPYWVRDWYDSNYNFFSAIEVEKYVIFWVLTFMVIVASFNISSTLFVMVLKKYSDVSVLKTLGATKAMMVRIFLLHGMALGILGSVLGVIMGVLLSQFVKYQNFLYIPAEVYKFDRLPVEYRIEDILLVLLASFVICFASVLIPAFRGAKLNPVEGLRYE